MIDTSDFDLSATDPSLRGTFEDLNMWRNWHYQADVLMFVVLVFIALHLFPFRYINYLSVTGKYVGNDGSQD